MSDEYPTQPQQPAGSPLPPPPPPPPPPPAGAGGLPSYPAAGDGGLPAYPTSGAPANIPPPPGYAMGAETTAGDGPNGTVLAAYGPRLGGWLIDFVLLFVVGQVIATIFDRAKVVVFTFHTTDNTTHVVTYHHESVLGIILRVAIVLLYGAILCGTGRGQTLGMLAVGVRAVDVRTGGLIGFWRGLGRASFEYLLAIVLFLPWVLDMLWPLWDRRNQTLHDKVSGTVVVKPAPVVA